MLSGCFFKQNTNFAYNSDKHINCGDIMNKQELYNMLLISLEAYSNKQPKSDEYEMIYIESQKDVECFIRIYKEKIIIAFRGSDSNADWHNNLLLCKKVIPYNNFNTKNKVHCGFLNGYKDKQIRDVIHKIISEHKYIFNIFVTGHSYGAALSVLCALDIKYNFPDINVVATLFGCPKVGNKHFVNSYNKRVVKTYRVEDPNDPITKLPFGFLGFRHVGTKIIINKYKFPLYTNFKYHSGVNYMEMLWRNYSP